MRLTMKIGVLAVQGAFIEHEHMIEEIGHTAIEIRQRDDLEGLDGLILPGGESTVQRQLLNKLDMMKDIKNMISNGLPTLATCAGLILLSEHIMSAMVLKCLQVLIIISLPLNTIIRLDFLSTLN